MVATNRKAHRECGDVVWKELVAGLLVVAGLALVLVPGPGTDDGIPSQGLRWTLAALIALPSAFSMLMAWGIGLESGRSGLTLHVHQDAPDPRVAEAVKKSWDYERDRYRRTLGRAELYAACFGAVTSLLLVGAVLLERWRAFIALDATLVDRLAISMAAAAATVYLVKFVTHVARMATFDCSGRTFSWGSRAIALVVIADVGLMLALREMVTSSPAALLLGILVGTVGEHAIDLLLEKAPKAFGLAPPAAKGASPLLAIDGITEQHAERFEEEGVVSVQDLALLPTARLFFNTPYGLAAVAEWQDQALLRVRVGAERARELSAQVGIRGATALRGIARHLLDHPADAGAAGTKAALRGALKLDKDIPLEPLLATIDEDEAVARLEIHQHSVVEKPAQFVGAPEEPEAAPGSDEFTCAPLVVSVEPTAYAADDGAWGIETLASPDGGVEDGTADVPRAPASSAGAPALGR